MSSAPQLSLDERERRAEERMQKMKMASGQLDGQSARGSQSGTARGAPSEPSPVRSIPKPGESLFDNYAQIQDPTKFSTDEEEVVGGRDARPAHAAAAARSRSSPCVRPRKSTLIESFIAHVRPFTSVRVCIRVV